MELQEKERVGKRRPPAGFQVGCTSASIPSKKASPILPFESKWIGQPNG